MVGASYLFLHSGLLLFAFVCFRLLPVVNCAVLRPIAHGFASGSEYTFGKTVSFSCSPGFALQGHRDLVCKESGRWNVPAPTCTPVKCPSLDAPANGVLTSYNSTYSAVTSLSCNEGYRSLQEQAGVMCLSSGIWNGTLSTCQPVKCPKLLVPLSVEEDSVCTTFGCDMLRVCAVGYSRKSGDKIRQCQADGTWSGEELLCQGTCFVLSGLHLV